MRKFVVDPAILITDAAYRGWLAELIDVNLANIIGLQRDQLVNVDVTWSFSNES